MIGPIAILFYDTSKSNNIEFGNLFYGCGIVSEHGIRKPLVPVGLIVVYIMSEVLRQCFMWAF